MDQGKNSKSEIQNEILRKGKMLSILREKWTF